MNFGAYTADGLMMMRMYGNEALDAEVLHAYELGWRWRPYQTLSFDVAVYRNDYDGLIAGTTHSAEFEFGPPPALVMTSYFANGADTRAEGVELVAEWAARDWLRFEAQTTWQNSGAASITGAPGSIDPKRMHMLRAQVDLPYEIDLDIRWRSVSDLTGLQIEGYDSLDMRAAWRPVEQLELAVAIENAFDDEHIEFSDDLVVAPGATIGRSVFARATWRPKR